MFRVPAVLLGLAALGWGADPVLRFSTYLGGSDRESAAQVAPAPDGNIVVALSTGSPDLPVTEGAVQKTLAPGTCTGVEEGAALPRRCSDIYVAVFSPSGEILRATYLGGKNDETLAGIRLDRAGNIWIAGGTASADFPVAKVIGTPDSPFSGAFVAELSASLSAVLQSTVMAGAAGPVAFTLDDAGSVYIVGATASSSLPTLNAIQPARTPGLPFAEGFIAKLAPGGGLAWATYFGGAYTSITAVASEASGGVLIGGYTEAATLPGGGVRYGDRRGPADAFLAEIAPDGKSVHWLRYLGGNGYDQLAAVATDAAGSIYAGGIAGTGDFPGDDYSGESALAPRGFVTKVTADGSAVLSSRLFGYYVAAISLDGAGGIWLTGTCCSGVLQASASALQTARNGYETDAYLVQLTETGPPLWASYIGGTGTDSGASVAATADGVILAGRTRSFDFPLNHPAQSGLHQNPDVSPILADAFVMRFAFAEPDAPAIRQRRPERSHLPRQSRPR